MSLEAWQAEFNGTLFAIVDGAADPSLVGRFYEHSTGEASPLFAGTPFNEHATLGPWLLTTPSADFVADTPLLSGFYLISEHSMEVVRRHWQSLIQVIREGEAVWFRFSEPRILLPILNAMSADEREAILGPCAGIWINGSTFVARADAPFTPALQTPWFHIHSHHLAALYDENRHAYILRRRLWQLMTRMMERHPDPANSLLAILRQANLDGLKGDVLDAVVAGALTLQAGMPLENIRAPLLLSEEEMAQARYWMARHNVLIGVSQWQ